MDSGYPHHRSAHRHAAPIKEEEYDSNSDDADGSGHRRASASDGDGSSPESRGKRRRLDQYAQGFDIAARSPRAPVRNNPADWSADSTFVLLEKWGELYVRNGRKSLRLEEWSAVARKVNLTSRITRSDTQCRNRLDTLKKKYKKETEKLRQGIISRSEWIYFSRMEELMGPPSTPPHPVSRVPPLRRPLAVERGQFALVKPKVEPATVNGCAARVELVEEDEDEESDGLPPPPRSKRSVGGLGLASCRMLAESIYRLGEVYERIEKKRGQQMADLERMREEFQRDLEAQKRRILEKAWAEIAKMREEEGHGEDAVGINEAEEENDGSADTISG